MKDIHISSGVRGNKEYTKPDDECRSIAIYGHGSNRCEMFYKISQAISSSKKVEITNDKAKRFMSNVERLESMQYEEILQDLSNEIVIGSTFSNNSQALIEYKSSSKSILDKIRNILGKLLPSLNQKNEKNTYNQMQNSYTPNLRERLEEFSADDSYNNKDHYKSIDLKTMDNPLDYIHEFAEGNEKLRELLTTCFDKDITTIYCCAGHESGNDPFIMMMYDEKLNTTLNNLYNNNDIGVDVDNIFGNDNTRFNSDKLRISFSCDLQNGNNMFSTLNELIAQDKESELNEELSASFQGLNELRKYAMSVMLDCKSENFIYKYVQRNSQRMESLEEYATEIKTISDSLSVWFVIPKTDSVNFLNLISTSIEQEHPVESLEIIKSEENEQR